ncbi:uncharacterized protein A1O5_06756 [Cladophialophora psammophila CBS 110553]|uniref:Heterokaryon incompatibility domain-containing protein n=1 Tax=Cladophialophora psammophila CBS 110553 TaxID=1182543 RepID=W9WX89_9EURO|nr:uncharacterized protein A1O5_06756 [Cladophialophora psammophila CBS 110553]EXJ69685.1 hypothetical protein A1O5_06756 [Cladophialophora psammophila CBS 110553]
MDHLPLPKLSSWEHIQVPYYICDDFEYLYKGPWATYHQRHGYYTPQEFYPRKNKPYPDKFKPRLAAFVQSWLWFGMLQEFLNEDLRLEDWTAPCTVEEDAKKTTTRISTCGLLAKLDHWVEVIQGKSDENRVSELKAIDYLLHDADRQKSHFELSEGSNFLEAWDVLPQSLLLSLNILINTLKIVRNSAWPDITPLQRHPGIFYDKLERITRHDGWCPVAVNALALSCDAISGYCVSLLGPVKSPQDHMACNPELCSALQVDHQTYQTRHIEPGCKCDMSEPLSRLVATILQANKIPIIRLGGPDGKLEVAASDCHEHNFVAISHVWSDGLGNLHHNSLPSCQLRKIQYQVNALMWNYSSKPEEKANTFFWIDTICVPVGSSFRAERNFAISQMVHVYRKASMTLILNAELNDIPSDTPSWELSARINRTAWFRRLWTLHEGIISRRCLFQLSDRAIKFSELIMKPPDHRSAVLSEIEKSILEQTSRMYTNMETFKALPRLERSREIWRAFAGRTTSNADDETICLSNMLGLDLTPILAIDRSDPDVCSKRMKAFLLEQKLFPQGLIFEAQSGSDFAASPEAAFREPGFRWAPRTFVFDTRGDYSTVHQSALATADARGLHAKLPGLMPGLSWEDFFCLARRDTILLKELDPSMNVLLVDISFMVPAQWDYHYEVEWQMPAPWHLGGKLLGSTRPAVILEEDLVNQDLDTRESDDGVKIKEFEMDVQLGVERAALAAVFERWVSGLLVALPREKSMVLHHGIGKVTEEIEALIVGPVSVKKSMFQTRQKSACDQITFDQGMSMENCLESTSSIASENASFVDADSSIASTDGIWHQNISTTLYGGWKETMKLQAALARVPDALLQVPFFILYDHSGNYPLHKNFSSDDSNAKRKYITEVLDEEVGTFALDVLTTVTPRSN